MAFNRASLVTILEGITALPDVEVSILYSRGGVPVLTLPPDYSNSYLLRQLGFVIRSEWSYRDILTDSDQWRSVSRELDSYIVLVAQISSMFLLGVVFNELTPEMEENLLEAIENIREALAE